MNAPVKKFKQSSRTGTAEPVTQALSSIAFYSELAAASSGQRFIVTAALSSYAKKNSPRLMLALRGDKVRPGRDARVVLALSSIWFWKKAVWRGESPPTSMAQGGISRESPNEQTPFAEREAGSHPMN
jgi:hypothetical protein